MPRYVCPTLNFVNLLLFLLLQTSYVNSSLFLCTYSVLFNCTMSRLHIHELDSVFIYIYSIIALTTCSICTIWNVQLSYSCFVIFVNSMSMSFNLWDNYWSCLFYPNLTHLCNFECNIGTKHLALLWTENWTSTVSCGWAFCMFRIIRKHVDCEVVNGNIPASCWFRIHIAKGGPSASGRDLPPVTGRSRVRVAVSPHCTGEGKACH